MPESVPFPAIQAPPVHATALGVVLCTDSHAARLVLLEGQQEPTPVVGHLASACAVVPGDHVLVHVSDGQAVIMDRLRRPGESPAACLRDDNGAIALPAGRSITLQVGRSRLELCADGEVWLDGCRIRQAASHDFSIRGASVKIN